MIIPILQPRHLRGYYTVNTGSSPGLEYVALDPESAPSLLPWLLTVSVCVESGVAGNTELLVTTQEGSGVATMI